jgi:hypothetical protein
MLLVKFQLLSLLLHFSRVSRKTEKSGFSEFWQNWPFWARGGLGYWVNLYKGVGASNIGPKSGHDFWGRNLFFWTTFRSENFCSAS